MNLTDAQFLRLRRLLSLLGLLPVATFVVFHLAVHALAIGGPGLYNSVGAALGRLPFVTAIEVALIGVPIAAHVALGILAANSEPASRLPHRYPSDRMHAIQRITGAFLTLWVTYHVWSTRLVPEVARGDADLYELVRRQVSSPLVLAAYALGVIAIAVHTGFGIVGMARRDGAETGAHPGARRLAQAVTALLLALGLSALLAFALRPGPVLVFDAALETR